MLACLRPLRAATTENTKAGVLKVNRNAVAMLAEDVSFAAKVQSLAILSGTSKG